MRQSINKAVTINIKLAAELEKLRWTYKKTFSGMLNKIIKEWLDENR